MSDVSPRSSVSHLTSHIPHLVSMFNSKTWEFVAWFQANFFNVFHSRPLWSSHQIFLEFLHVVCWALRESFNGAVGTIFHVTDYLMSCRCSLRKEAITNSLYVTPDHKLARYFHSESDMLNAVACSRQTWVVKTFLSGRMIYHISFHIFHFSLEFSVESWVADWISRGRKGNLAPALKWQMKNVKWYMVNHSTTQECFNHILWPTRTGRYP